MKNLFAKTLLWSGLALAGATAPAMSKDITAPFQSYEPWPDSVVDAFRRVLVQDGGRVKPVHTYSRFTLLQLSGRSSVRFETGDGETHKVEAVAWLLDVLFRGDRARGMPLFIVDDSETVIRLGIEPKEKRDRYSYADLLPARARLARLAAEIGEKQRRYDQSGKDPQYELDRIEGMVQVLGQNVSSFEYLLGQFGFARKGRSLTNEEVLPDHLKEMAARLDMVEMMEVMPEMSLNQLIQSVQAPGGEGDDEAKLQSAMQLFFFYANSGRGLNLFPPRDQDDEQWLSIGDVMLAGLASKEARPWAIREMKRVRALVEAEQKGMDAFGNTLAEFAKEQREAADARGEAQRSGMEVRLYQGKFFSNSLVCFLIAFVLLSLSWLAPGTAFARVLTWAVVGLLIAGLLLVTYGITLRCLIRHRPPITNLYDTVLFITGTAVLLGLLVEWFTRIGIGLLAAVLSGVIGMFLSIRYEIGEATDTIHQLVAVLDTNFWLATHVTVINIGYAAGMLAAILSSVYLVGRFFHAIFGIDARAVKAGAAGMIGLSKVSAGLRENIRNEPDRPREFYRTITRMAYGIVCFCLFFSLIGTVLGGIWANYSWGRFWGWDPKENGALMICLWTLAILHARLGDFIRDIGINVASVFLGVIVTFSWWGVNNLGVGLHSYGFTDGVWKSLFGAWFVAGLIMLCGFPLWLQERKGNIPKESAKDGGMAEGKTAAGTA